MQEADLPDLAALLRSDWHAAVAREGLDHLDHPAAPTADGDDPPCPACGTAAPLVEGACSDCGLQLE